MESKNTVFIALAVVLVLAVGFFTYRHFRGKKALSAHHEETYRRMTSMAQKMPKVGVREMGAAINRFKKANKAYPQSLGELYPDFIPYRDFIDKISWQYRVDGDNFSLSKSVARKNRTVVVSIDKRLSTKVGTGSRMVAGSASTSSGPASDASVGVRLKTGLELLASLKAPDVNIENASDTGALGPLRIESRHVILDENSEMTPLAKSVSKAYLVWKDAEGNLGFGNVQYPLVRQFAIASRDQWYNVKHQDVEAVKKDVGEIDSIKEEAAVAGGGKTKLFSSLSSGPYLAWRDKNGVIGFGNVDYPDLAEIVAVNVNGQWEKVVPHPVGR